MSTRAVDACLRHRRTAFELRVSAPGRAIDARCCAAAPPGPPGEPGPAVGKFEPAFVERGLSSLRSSNRCSRQPPRRTRGQCASSSRGKPRCVKQALPVPLNHANPHKMDRKSAWLAVTWPENDSNAGTASLLMSTLPEALAAHRIMTISFFLRPRARSDVKMPTLPLILYFSRALPLSAYLLFCLSLPSLSPPLSLTQPSTRPCLFAPRAQLRQHTQLQ